MVTLGTLDYTVFALFIGLIFALGFSARLRDNSTMQFLSAGRQLTLPLFVATLVSTWYGGILGVGETVAYNGLGTWLLIGVPYYIFALIYAFFLARRVRDAEQISIPERLEAKYGLSAGLVGAVLIFLLAVPAAHVLMLGVLVKSFTGWESLTATLIGCAVGVSFLYKGGLLADVRVALLAFLMMYVGFAVIVVWCAVHYPLPNAWKAVENPAFLTLSGGAQWPYILSFLILGAWTLVDPAFHQRVASAASPDTSRKGVLVSVLFWFLFDVLSISAAMYALVLLKPLPEDVLLIYPLLAEKVLPSGLKAVFLCGVGGTVLSAMVGYTLVSGATIGRELVGRMRRDLPDERLTAWTRGGLFIALVIAIALALTIDSVVALWYAWAGAIIGALLLPVLFAYSRRAASLSPASVVTAMSVAFAAAVVWLVYGTKTGNSYLEVGILRTEGGFKLVLPTQEPASQALLAESSKISVGTLLPGLLVSTVILAAGAILNKRKGNAGRQHERGTAATSGG